MSEEAAADYALAVRWNPDGAKYLLDILRTVPICVRYNRPMLRTFGDALLLFLTNGNSVLTLLCCSSSLLLQERI